MESDSPINASGYVIKTEQFEGPFAVLLEMIEAEKLEITDISLFHVTEQFFAYIHSHEQLPAQELADFLCVAAKLLYIKSKAVLPPSVVPDDQEGPSLESQLRMYKAYKDATVGIEQRYESSATSFFGKIKTPLLAAKFYPPRSLTVDQLAQTMRAIIDHLQPLLALPSVHVERVVSINEKIEHIKQSLAMHEHVRFTDMHEQGNRADMIVSFLAILELVKSQSVSVQQSQPFDDLIIARV